MIPTHEPLLLGALTGPMSFFSTVVTTARLGRRDMNWNFDASGGESLHEVVHVQLFILEDVSDVCKWLRGNGLGIDCMLGQRPKGIVKTVLVLVFDLFADVFKGQLLLNHIGLQHSLVHESNLGNGFIKPFLDQIERSMECMTISSIASSFNKAFEHDQGEVMVILSRFDQKFGIPTEIRGKLMQVLT